MEVGVLGAGCGDLGWGGCGGGHGGGGFGEFCYVNTVVYSVRCGLCDEDGGEDEKLSGLYIDSNHRDCSVETSVSQT